MEDLKKHLNSYMLPDSGLMGIMLSDKDGVPVLRVTSAQCPDTVTRSSFVASFAGTSQEVGGKLGLGNNNTLVAVYGEHQVVHHQHEAVILTLVANSSADTGHLMNLTTTLQPFLEDISAVIAEP